MTAVLRVIPRLDIKGDNLVKGVHLEGLRVLGKPEYFAQHYYHDGADELFFQDVVASLLGRNSLHEVISRTAQNVFIPLTVSGGLRTLDDIASVLRAGADKVAINTAAHECPEFIADAVTFFGKSTIAVSVEAVQQPDGTFEAFTDNGRNRTGRRVSDWIQRVEKLGAGEIVLTSVDRDGTGEGPDLALISEIHKSLSVPLVIHGGIGEVSHIVELIGESAVSGVALASMLHYDFLRTHRQVEGYEVEGNIEFLKSGRMNMKVSPLGVTALKKRLHSSGVACRML